MGVGSYYQDPQHRARALYGELINSEFGFMPRGIRDLPDIYDAVAARYPELCDET